MFNYQTELGPDGGKAITCLVQINNLNEKQHKSCFGKGNDTSNQNHDFSTCFAAQSLACQGGSLQAQFLQDP